MGKVAAAEPAGALGEQGIDYWFRNLEAKF
jgi:hypothetical protein